MRHPTGELAALPNVTLLKLDVTDPAEIQSVVHDVESETPVDVVMNNAGYALMGALEGLSDDQIMDQLNTNVMGTIRVTKAFLPYFRERKKGLFLNVTSTTVLLPDPFLSVYSASKGAIETWSAAMRSELSKVGIGIKTIMPDLMNTRLVANAKLELHPAYLHWTDKILEKFNTPGAFPIDQPAEVAPFIYEAAIDESDKLQYLVGNNAIQAGAAIEKYGVNAVRAEKERYLFS